MSKIPPAMWEDPAAFVPDEERPATEEAEPDDGVFKRIAEEDDEAVQDPDEQPRH
jgi:hypothetical protein